MAKWTVYKQGNGKLGIVYRNSITGATEKLGELNPFTTDRQILSWIVSDGDANPGDLIVVGTKFYQVATHIARA